MGYTIDRVSLFALIFSIGILVDDAIVVVENISRRWAMRDGRSLADAAVEAVAEVGNPTIVATLTIVAALLPMMFASGLMSPYISPVPANASIAMLFSFVIAVTVTPWLRLRFVRRRIAAAEAAHVSGRHDIGAMGRFYAGLAQPLLDGRARSKVFLVTVGVAIVAACTLFVTEDVRVKLLPFDNKSEIQIVLDLPHGASLEDTDRTLTAAAERLKDLPELTSIQAYAGTAAVFNFSGLMRHHTRENPEQGDLSVNLVENGERKRASHAIALDIRRRLADLPLPAGSALKIVEVPPGRPVLATLLAEVDRPDAESRRALAAAQFGSFLLPLVILVPVPLTLIGIVLGHWLLGAAFTATSMIGFIALAGIIVRNSILLADFICNRRAEGRVALREALIESGATRFKPIVLTDPIFPGLAISMVFGLASSTALTVLVIPAIYAWLRDDKKYLPGPRRRITQDDRAMTQAIWPTLVRRRPAHPETLPFGLPANRAAKPRGAGAKRKVAERSET
jgi:multidrug efflux pump subunit AcrB